MFTVSCDLTWRATAEGHVVEASPALLHFLRLPLERIRDYSWASCIHPDDVARVVGQWMFAIKTSQPFDAFYRVRSGDDWVRVHGHAEAVNGEWEGVAKPVEVDIDTVLEPIADSWLKVDAEVPTTAITTQAGIFMLPRGTRQPAAVNSPHFAMNGGVMTEQTHVYYFRIVDGHHAHAADDPEEAVDFARLWNEREKRDPVGIIAFADVDGIVHQKCTNSDGIVHSMDAVAGE